MSWGRKNHLGRKFALSAVVGGAAGYLAGILTAPKSGKETREDIAEKVGDIKEESKLQLMNLSEELKVLLAQAKGKTVALSSQAREEFNEAIVKAKDAQNKAGTVLKAVKAGEAQEPELNKAIKQARQAIKNLNKYLKN